MRHMQAFRPQWVHLSSYSVCASSNFNSDSLCTHDIKHQNPEAYTLNGIFNYQGYAVRFTDVEWKELPELATGWWVYSVETVLWMLSRDQSSRSDKVWDGFLDNSPIYHSIVELLFWLDFSWYINIGRWQITTCINVANWVGDCHLCRSNLSYGCQFIYIHLISVNAGTQTIWFILKFYKGSHQQFS